MNTRNTTDHARREIQTSITTVMTRVCSGVLVLQGADACSVAMQDRVHSHGAEVQLVSEEDLHDTKIVAELKRRCSENHEGLLVVLTTVDPFGLSYASHYLSDVCAHGLYVCMDVDA